MPRHAGSSFTTVLMSSVSSRRAVSVLPGFASYRMITVTSLFGMTNLQLCPDAKERDRRCRHASVVQWVAVAAASRTGWSRQSLGNERCSALTLGTSLYTIYALSLIHISEP